MAVTARCPTAPTCVNVSLVVWHEALGLVYGPGGQAITLHVGDNCVKLSIDNAPK